MMMEAHKLISKLYSLISKFTVSVASRYIFNHSVHFLTNMSNYEASLILVGRQVAEWRSGEGVGFRTMGSLVRTPAGAHFVVALSKSHLACLVLVEPRKRWTDDRLGQTVTRLEITLCLMPTPRDLVFRPDNMDETVPHTH